MTRFLAIPRHDNAVASLNFAEVRFSPEARMAQTDNLRRRRLQLEDASSRSGRVSELALNLGAKQIQKPFDVEGASITGIEILEGDPEQLSALQAALPEFEVIEDVPMNLVPPVRAGANIASAGGADIWHLDAIRVQEARDAGFLGKGNGVGVAVLDTGISEVAEISGRVASAFEFDSSTGAAVQVQTSDTEGHGTHVAGLIAGATVGVAPGADLMNAIMIPGGFGNLSDFVFAIEFIGTRPEISIMNMSAGIQGFNPGMKAAMRAVLAVGILPVIAIGNEGANTSRSPGNYTEALSVGASTRQSKVAGFSGGGTMIVDHQSYTVPDLVAPGQEVTSCVMGAGFEAWNGTSMATPIVSGVAALIIEAAPQVTEPDLRSEIVSVLKPLPGIPQTRQGDGLLQLPSWLWFSSA